MDTRTPEAVAQAEAILDRLRACTTVDQVNTTAAEIAAEVKQMAGHDPFILHDARGLVHWLRVAISNGWWPRKSEPASGCAPRAGSNRTADCEGTAMDDKKSNTPAGVVQRRASRART